MRIVFLPPVLFVSVTIVGRGRAFYQQFTAQCSKKKKKKEVIKTKTQVIKVKKKKIC